VALCAVPLVGVGVFVCAMIENSDSPSCVLGPRQILNYFDVQTMDVGVRLTALEAWSMNIAQPVPFLKTAFKVRDWVSSLFGVKKIGGFTGKVPDEVAVGDQIDFFLVEYYDPTTLVLTVRDRHLDVVTCVSTVDTTVSITSSVIVHNWFGHIYMKPVGVAHRWIVWFTLRRMARRLTLSKG